MSTLRRRIKATDIHFRLEDGKYFIIDEPISAHQRTHRPSQDPTSTLVSTSSPSRLFTDTPKEFKDLSRVDSRSETKSETKIESKVDIKADIKAEIRAENKSEKAETKAESKLDSRPKSILRANKDEPILTAANRLLNELKKAYSQILQEKEEQIMQLKDEQADLKTLIRVLEGENQRLVNQQKTKNQ